MKVAAYIKKKHRLFTDLMARVFEIGSMTDNQFLGIVFMTVLIGEAWVENLPKMLINYRHKEHLICTLEPALVTGGLARDVAKWVVSNIKEFNSETPGLI